MTPPSDTKAEQAAETRPGRHDTPRPTNLINVSGKSGRGTARQTIRMDEDLWVKLDAAAQALGTDRSALLREYARWAVREKGAKAPRRGPASTTEQS